MNKLAPNNDTLVSLKEPIVIDLSSHYKNSLSEKIEILKQSIKEKYLVSFEYYSSKGKSVRMIEPYFVAFKWAAWYVFGYCNDREDFRLFKLNRLWKIVLCSENYVVRDIPVNKADLDAWQTDENPIVLLFDESVKYLLVESYGPNCFTETDNGKLRFEGAYTKKDYIIGWILSYGDKATVLEPLELRQEIRSIADNIIKNNC